MTPRAPLQLRHPRSPARRRGFTLIEILVVVAILIILVALLVTVGNGARSNAQIRQTHLTLHTLDGAMNDYLKDGNPEPAIPTPWPYTNPPQEYTQTKDPITNRVPDSDPINWVKFFKAHLDSAKAIASMTYGVDANGNAVVLDAFGTPIRYVPYDATTKKNGYFVSAGPDRIFANTIDPPPAPAKLAPDDLFSTDP